MAYPTSEQYGEALQDHKRWLLDPELRKGEFKLNAWGVPHPISGGFALTYDITTGRKRFAVRCFHKESKHLEKRYREISKKIKSLQSPYFLDFEFQNEGIKCNKELFPIVKMEWGKGETLGNFLSQHYKEKLCLSNLQKSLRSLSLFLEENGIAHGDIQPDNVMVSDNGCSIQLIDYDGMFVEALKDYGSAENGHLNFQHPKRIDGAWNSKIDRFSFILLDLVLDILKSRPSLWEETQSNDEAVLLKADDFESPSDSTIIRTIYTIPEFRKKVSQFVFIAQNAFEKIPALEEFISGEKIPLFDLSGTQKIDSGKSKSRHYRANYPVLDGNDSDQCAEYVGQKVEVIGKIFDVYESEGETGKPYVFINFGFFRDLIFKITVWNVSLLSSIKKNPQDLEGEWVSITGLMERYNKNGRDHVQINLASSGQLQLLNNQEASFRLNRAPESNKSILKKIADKPGHVKIPPLTTVTTNTAVPYSPLSGNRAVIDAIRAKQKIPNILIRPARVQAPSTPLKQPPAPSTPSQQTSSRIFSSSGASAPILDFQLPSKTVRSTSSTISSTGQSFSGSATMGNQQIKSFQTTTQGQTPLPATQTQTSQPKTMNAQATTQTKQRTNSWFFDNFYILLCLVALLGLFTHGVYPEGFPNFQEIKNTSSQSSLGIANRFILQNFAEMPKRFRKPIEKWYSNIQSNLGNLILKDRSIPQENIDKMDQLQQSAKRGHADAQLKLGFIFFHGQGVSQDYSEAEKWYRRAAEQGNPEGQFNLGVIYADGLGVSQNLKTAYIWYSLSAQSSEGDLKETAVYLRDQIAKKLSPAALGQAQQIASEWRPKKEIGK